jgi:tRNA(fMet)-specific endonuclease VapC
MASVGDASIVMCAVVAGELYFGASKSNNPTKAWAITERFVNRFRSYVFDDQAAKHYGVVRNDLERAGKMIGSNDLLIASIALANSLTLVTHNVGEFGRVKGLQIVDWQTTTFAK